MLVRHLSLHDFRNYESAELTLGEGPNVFVGSNGQGKTNLVEAIGYFSTLGSHRVANDSAMIRQGADAAIVRARIEHGEQSVLLEVQLNRGSANRAQVNRGAVRPRELPRYFSSVIFAPEDLSLVRGDPSGRRRFLDELLVLRNPRLSGVLADYDRALRQRNTLLKSIRASNVSQLTTLDVWDEKLVQFGAEVIAARSALVVELTPEVERAYASVAGAEHAASLSSHLSIHAHSTEDDAELDPDALRGGPVAVEDAARDLASALRRLRRQELHRGVTLAGPHRDDLVLQLNGLPAKGYASHGESWSFALALKLASAEVLRRDAFAGDPVLVLDDVFAELDESRRGRLAAAVAGYEQVLITAAVEDDVPTALAGRMVRIRAGRVLE